MHHSLSSINGLVGNGTRNEARYRSVKLNARLFFPEQIFFPAGKF